jgi:hypothetical protein
MPRYLATVIESTPLVLALSEAPVLAPREILAIRGRGGAGRALHQEPGRYVDLELSRRDTLPSQFLLRGPIQG